MKIPPELAALQRYGWYHEDTKRAAIGPDVNGHLLKYDDVARAWPKPASGEAKPVAWQYRLSNQWMLTNQNPNNFGVTDDFPQPTEITPLYAHPADTSALRECLRECVESMAGYRREHNHEQPCDAEKRARTLLDG